MKSLSKSLFAAMAAGSLWLTAAASPMLAAPPTSYQATGPILEITDTTITIQFHGKEKWTFAKDASTSGTEGLKVGDSVTVHYTMTAGSIEPSKAGTPAKGGKKAAATAPTSASASPAAAASASPKP